MSPEIFVFPIKCINALFFRIINTCLYENTARSVLQEDPFLLPITVSKLNTFTQVLLH